MLGKVVVEENYSAVVRKFIANKLEEFEKAGGWEVLNEQAQRRCTFHRYIETGVMDCDNTAKLLEGLRIILEAVKRELEAKVECLEAKQFQQNYFCRMTEIINETVEEARINKKFFLGLYESCTNDTVCSNKENTVDSGKENHPPTACITLPVEEEQSCVEELQVPTNTSRNDQIRVFTKHDPYEQNSKKLTKALLEKSCRPPTSLTGSFTIDQEEETVTIMEPEQEDTAAYSDGASQAESNVDILANGSKNENVELVHITKPPVLKSELAKQWIREVAKRRF